MERRSFLKKLSTASLAAGFIPQFGLAHFMPTKATPLLVPLENPVKQIRHGALNFPLFSDRNPALPFDWLLQVQRNIFFKNGFQRSETKDLEIISILLQTDADAGATDALQVQLEATQTTAMWGDHLESIPLTQNWSTIGQADPSQALYLAHWSEGQATTPDLGAYKELYLQVLEGQISCNGQIIDSNTGLAFAELETLEVEALSDCRVLFLARSNS